MIKLLLDFGADLFQEISIDAKTGLTKESLMNKNDFQPKVFRYCPGLGIAAVSRHSNSETIDFLLEQGADLNQLDLNGETLLHKACESGNTEIARHLIKFGIDVNKGKPTNESP